MLFVCIDFPYNLIGKIGESPALKIGLYGMYCRKFEILKSGFLCTDYSDWAAEIVKWVMGNFHVKAATLLLILFPEFDFLKYNTVALQYYDSSHFCCESVIGCYMVSYTYEHSHTHSTCMMRRTWCQKAQCHFPVHYLLDGPVHRGINDRSVCVCVCVCEHAFVSVTL